MLRRILLTLLTVCLALPAAVPVAARAQAPAPMEMTQHLHHTGLPASDHDQGQHSSKHQCLGCAASLEHNPMAESRLQIRAAITHAWLVDGLPEARAGPETPPPRI